MVVNKTIKGENEVKFRHDENLLHHLVILWLMCWHVATSKSKDKKERSARVVVSLLQSFCGFAVAKFLWFRCCKVFVVSLLQSFCGFAAAKFLWFHYCKVFVVSLLQSFCGFS